MHTQNSAPAHLHAFMLTYQVIVQVEERRNTSDLAPNLPLLWVHVVRWGERAKDPHREGCVLFSRPTRRALMNDK